MFGRLRRGETVRADPARDVPSVRKENRRAAAGVRNDCGNREEEGAEEHRREIVAVVHGSVREWWR